MGFKKKDLRSSIDLSHLPPVPLNVIVGKRSLPVVLYYILTEFAAVRGLKEINLTRKQIARLMGLKRLGTVSEALRRLAVNAWIVKDVYNVMDDESGVVNRLIRIRFNRQFAAPQNFDYISKKKPSAVAVVTPIVTPAAEPTPASDIPIDYSKVEGDLEIETEDEGDEA